MAMMLGWLNSCMSRSEELINASKILFGKPERKISLERQVLKKGK
jgi:hypothetical protein